MMARRFHNHPGIFKGLFMGLFGKSKISELDAASQFVLTMLSGVEQGWQAITTEFAPLIGSKAAKLNNPWAQHEFMLAVISSQLQALPNLFPPDQARRMRAHALAMLTTPELGSEPCEMIQAYEQAWKNALHNSEAPFGAMASILYDRLRLVASVEIGGERFKSPLLLMAMGMAVTSFKVGWWKNLQSSYRVVE
jgi:hypothetical protein